MGIFAVASVAANVLVESAQKQFPIVWESAKAEFSKVPLRGRNINQIDPATGQKYQFVIPEDMDRRYDEAYFNSFERRVQLGYHIPKATAGGSGLKCKDTPLFGYGLGFVYGLQFDRKVKGKCYQNLESAILALDTIFQMAWMLLLPWEFPKTMLAF